MIEPKQLHTVLDEFSSNSLSLYLLVDPAYIENQAQTPAWSIWLKNSLRDIEKNLTADQESIWQSIIQRVENYFSVYKPDSKTLVLWMDQNHQQIEELPFAIANRAAFGEALISPLLQAMDEYKRYLIVLVDKEHAIVRSAYLGNFETEAEMTIDLDYDWGERTLMPVSNGDGSVLSSGNNREAFADMIEAHVHRFYKDVAEEVASIQVETQAKRIIFGGDERSAHEINELLHESIQKDVVAILPIPMTASVNEISQKMWQTAYNYERHFESDLVDDIVNRAHAQGHGLVGRQALVTAMERQQVESLILPSSLVRDDPLYAQDLTNWALEHHKHIEFIHGQAAQKLEAEGGVAARLYYRIESN